MVDIARPVAAICAFEAILQRVDVDALDVLQDYKHVSVCDGERRDVSGEAAANLKLD